MNETSSKGLVWFRRDLRSADHAALYHALRSCQQVFAVFVYEREILEPLPRTDRRVAFIHDALADLERQLSAWVNHHHAGQAPVHGVLIQRYGNSADEIPALAQALGVQWVFANHDDEPFALQRDRQVRGRLAERGIGLKTFKDHVIFERQEVLSAAGHPYTVFTPYKNAWLKKLTPADLAPYPTESLAAGLRTPPKDLATPPMALAQLGFDQAVHTSDKLGKGSQGGQSLLADFLPRLDRYDKTRDYPAVKGPSYLGIHLRFGTVSVRQVAALAWRRAQEQSPGAQVWLNELVWRDFYAQILANFPHVTQASFKPAYDKIEWEKGVLAKARFDAWCMGATGYPLVDAAMHQLNQTGYMHNRLRMVAASFLCKHLGLNWLWGEAYFAEKLNDFDLASNNGGWQWASSSGCDAQPFFRIFNPVLQSKKFDPDGKFLARYLPVLAQLPPALRHAPWMAPAELLGSVRLGQDYPLPIVDHQEARAQTLARYRCVQTTPAKGG